MPIDPAEVRRIAALARLGLDERTVETFRHQLQTILDHVAMLDRLDVDAVPPTAGLSETGQPLRADRRHACLPERDALGNAPDAAMNLFRVPRVIEE